MLRWSLKLGTLLGVPVRLHWTFLLLIGWLVAAPLFAGQPGALGAGLRTAGFVASIFMCVVLHEMGHALAARRYGIATRDIVLLPIGGIASLERIPEKPVQELVVALAGPAVNVVIALLIIPALLLTEGPGAFTAPPGEASGGPFSGLQHTRFLASLGMVNIALVVFNMIPALPMDGGRVLRALLAMAMDRPRATAVAAGIGQVLAVGFALLGIFTGNILLVVIALFVFMGAGSEAQHEQFSGTLRGLPVRSAMVTRFRTLRASDPIRHAAQELLAGSQQDFPVLADGAADDRDAAAIVGVLTRVDLLRALAEGGGSDLESPVSGIMQRGCPIARENDNLLETISAARAGTGDLPGGSAAVPLIAVVGPGTAGRPPTTLVGLVTAENLTELVMLRLAIRARPGTGGPQAPPA